MLQKLTSVLPSDFVELLHREAVDTNSGNRRFIPRNFLLDEGVVEERGASYRQVIADERPSDFAAWGGAHEGYLTERVSIPRAPDATDGMSHQSDRPDSLPETFRHPAAFARFGGAHSSVLLLRVEPVTPIARLAAVAGADVVDLAHAISNGEPTTSRQAQRLDGLLGLWQNQLDSRPVFAGFFECFKDWFGDQPAADRNGWADHLRNALGLYHLSAGTTVLVFRYSVGEIRLWRGTTDTRPLVPPTVLDGRHSEAFCPAPAKRPTGHTVDLAAGGLEPAGEVLHPWIPFTSRNLFRVGTIDQPVPAILDEARGTHLLAIRDLSAIMDYGSDTDADLVGGTK